MKRRFPQFPVVKTALVAVSLLLGLALGPVAAQQSGLVNGAVTVRSDGAVYLISDGMRRWVATVVITDEELNAYPEGEPIYSALAPFGAATASASPQPATGAPSASPATKVSTAASKTPGSAQPAASSDPTSSTGVEVQPGDVVVDPASGADVKDPNDPTLAAPPTTVDPTGRTNPSGGTCPDSHQIKGAAADPTGVKFYYETDRIDYPNITPVECFRAGKDARDAGYVESKKR